MLIANRFKPIALPISLHHTCICIVHASTTHTQHCTTSLSSSATVLQHLDLLPSRYRMDPGPSRLSNHGVNKQFVCVCRQYCGGQPRLLSEAAFYRHLAEAAEDEHHLIEAVKASSVEAASMILSNRNSSNTRDQAAIVNEAGPSRGTQICPSARRIATLQVLTKRAREDPDSQKRAGKRKCARNNGNLHPNVS